MNLPTQQSRFDILKETGELFPGALVEEINKTIKVHDLGPHISDGYHTFDELYMYRLLYNAAFFNMLARTDSRYRVHKSKRHHDGEECFGGGWFIVMAYINDKQISNHYELKYWDLFRCEAHSTADVWDGHSPEDVTVRLTEYLVAGDKLTISH